MFAIQVVELCGQCFDQLFFLCFETIAAVFFKAHNPSLDWILQSILDVASYLVDQIVKVSIENVLVGLLCALIVAWLRGIFGGGCR